MALDKETAKKLKRERGPILINFVAYVDGYTELVNSFESIFVFKTGIFMEGPLNIKGFIPLEEIIEANLQGENYNIIYIHTEKDDFKIVSFRFNEAKQALKCFIKLREVIGHSLNQDEVEAYNAAIKMNIEQIKKEKADIKRTESEQKRIENEKRIAEYEAKRTEQEEKEREQKLYSAMTGDYGKETRKEKIKRLQAEDKVYCPKCLSTQITAHKKGFSVGQAITFGTLAGMAGSNKFEITCLSCGNKFKPGQK